MMANEIPSMATTKNSSESDEQKPEPVWPAEMVSGTLPIIYIDTENNDSIVDKERKIPATFYADCSAREEYDNIASIDSALTLTIKGRGNASWLLPKKPYKLKFDKKQSLFGLPKNKHYALLADVQMMTPLSIIGMEMGRQIGMTWAPHMQPVELILNGNYDGTYLLAESVKISSGRVDIYEQPEGNEDEELIPYGWLVEIDNYSDNFQITIPEKDGALLRITHKSPELLSTAQRDWLIHEFTEINSAIYSEDKKSTTWSDYLDMTSFAQYFIVSEVMHNLDAYTGSFYIHKDKGVNAKWIAGPLWDVTWCQQKEDWVIYSRTDNISHWMKELVKYPAFVDEIQRLWLDFYPDGVNAAIEHLDYFAGYVNSSIEANNNRWPGLKLNSSRFKSAKEIIVNNAEWVNENIGNLIPRQTWVNEIRPNKTTHIDGSILKITDEDVTSITAISVTGVRTPLPMSKSIDLKPLGKGYFIICVAKKDGSTLIKKIII